jgi:hypothetical protein
MNLTELWKDYEPLLLAIGFKVLMGIFMLVAGF